MLLCALKRSNGVVQKGRTHVTTRKLTVHHSGTTEGSSVACLV